MQCVAVISDDLATAATVMNVLVVWKRKATKSIKLSGGEVK